MNSGTIFSIFLLLMIIISPNFFFQKVYSSGSENENKDISKNIKIGTVCSDQSGQFSFSLVNNGTSFSVQNAKCTIQPDESIDINRDLTGTLKSDIIYGREGLDVISGKSGDDILNGGSNDDEIYGDDGEDNLLGSSGDDFLFGGKGNDNLIGSYGDDYLSGDDGNDELYGDYGSDILKGGKGADFFSCGEDFDMVIDFDSKQGDSHTDDCEDLRQNLN